MATNRKTQGDGVRFSTVARVVLLCAFFGGSAIGYVWQQSQIVDLSKRKVVLERELHELQLQNRRRVDQYESQLLPKALEDRVRRMNLGLAPYDPVQVIRLTEPVAGQPAALTGDRPAAGARLAASAERR